MLLLWITKPTPYLFWHILRFSSKICSKYFFQQNKSVGKGWISSENETFTHYIKLPILPSSSLLNKNNIKKTENITNISQQRYTKKWIHISHGAHFIASREHLLYIFKISKTPPCRVSIKIPITFPSEISNSVSKELSDGIIPSLSFFLLLRQGMGGSGTD